MSGDGITANVIRPEDALVCGMCGEGAGEAGDVEIEEEMGMRRPARVLDPKKPKPEEVEEHNKIHLPYRNWCRH